METLNETLHEVSDEELERQSAITACEDILATAQRNLESAQEQQPCAAREALEAHNKYQDLLKHINGLPNDERPSILVDKLCRLQSAWEALRFVQEQDAVQRHEIALGKAKTKLGVAQDRLKETQTKYRDISHHITLVAAKP